jgi:hypothetical protein
MRTIHGLKKLGCPVMIAEFTRELSFGGRSGSWMLQKRIRWAMRRSRGELDCLPQLFETGGCDEHNV